ncbi:iron-containing alcohol dehydrogenase family protein [Natronoglomus mannanivorans]|uniref:Iron-containing alcohol dehydrogenase family protein n=1 Tax=Natronoglomus mannanivorans TaxID=2979990 RepID=A0AAP3E2D4_9EURY|nr:iron-containing alcohol dehydrogenase family protein [Halobacteria archaeon AArc-xg1-1]
MTDPETPTDDPSFRFEYDPAILRAGPGCVDDLETELATQGFDRALVVCGSTVGSTPAVIDPVTEGLGDRLAGVFAETTPEKRLETAVDGLERLRAVEADVLVSLGGGSSLDTAKVISVLAASNRSPDVLGRELADTGTIAVPDDGLPPIVAIPTTLAGADLSMVAGVTASPSSGLVDEEASGGVGDPQLMPAAVFADPELVATTPRSVLAASAMNGFDKGIETLYARNATPITDATAIRGLEKLHDGLLAFGRGSDDDETFGTLVEGILLVQYGISRPGESTLSIIHAFGHGLTRTYDVQQGAAHAIVAPAVLEYLFEHVDGRRELLAEALGVSEAAESAEVIVDAVDDIGDALGLPSRLRDVDGPDRSEFPDVAEAILADGMMENVPAGLEPTAEEIEGVLERAW